MATLTLSWAAVTLSADGLPEPVPPTYNLYGGTDPTNLPQLRSGIVFLRAVITGLVDGATYYFAISATEAGIEGARSGIFSIKVPVPLAWNEADWGWDEDPDDFFADDFGNDSLLVPAAPGGLTGVLS